MDIFDQVSADIKSAMLAKDSLRLEALRGIKKEFLEAKTAKGGSGELSEEMALKILTKMVKQRKEAAEIYMQQQRSDLADKEMAEVECISYYLPQQLTEGELEAIVRELLKECGASTPADMGKVMGLASKRLAGKAEGKAISEMVKRLLS